MSNWSRLVHRLNSKLLKVHPIVWILIALLLAKSAFAAEVQKQAWLVVVYLPIAEEPMPRIRIHKIDKVVCNTQAKQIYNNVKASKVRAFCL